MAKLYASKAEFGVSFKFTTARPLDDRFVVENTADIYDPATWGGTLYTGLTVATSGGTLYTYVGPAGDADAFAASLVEGKIPTANWKVQGGDAQASIGQLGDKVAAVEKTANDNKTAIAAVKETADNAVAANTAITAATDFSVVKYDAKGLVTEGQVLNAANVPGLSALEAKVDKIGVVTKTDAGAYLKSYTFTGPDGKTVDINIPKDLVVTAGEVVKEAEGTFLKLTIANQAEPVKINVKDLANIYTVADTAKVNMTLSDTNQITADIVAGSIAKTDLATAVQASLDKADAAAPQTALDEAKKEIAAVKTDLAGHSVKSVEAAGTGYVTATAATVDGVATVNVSTTDALATAVTKAGSALQSSDIKAGTGMLTLNVKGTEITVPHGTMAEADATTYLTKDDTNAAIDAKAEEINGTIEAAKTELSGQITALENAKLTAGDGISVENNKIAIKKQAVAATPTLSVDASNKVTYANELAGTANTYVDSETLASIVNNTNTTIATTVNALNTKVAASSQTAAKKLDNIKINGVAGTVAAEGGLQISTVTLDAAKINYKEGVTVSKQLDQIVETLQWTEVAATPA